MIASLKRTPVPPSPQRTPCTFRAPAWPKLLMSLLLFLAVTVSVSAQVVTFRQEFTRVTVPVGYTGTVIFTNLVSISTNGIVPGGPGGTNITVNDINVGVTGVPSIPAGLTVTLTDTNQPPNPVTTLQGKLNTSGFKTNVNVVLTFSGIPEGLYTLSLNASGGATNNILFAVQAGYVWAGGTNAVVTGAGDISSGARWANGVAPGAGDDLIFGDLGGQSNSLTGFSTVATNLLTNVVVSANTTVGSLRFSSTNSINKFYNIQILDGKTLSVTGSNGLSFIKDWLNGISGSTAGLTTTFAGPNATLLVSNESANVFTYVDNAQASLWDMSGLGQFASDVNQVGIGDYSLWPYYRNLNDQNAYGGVPKMALPSVNLARTNIIKAVFVDPFNYTNADNRSYGFSFMKASEIQGSGTSPNFNLGISNIFYVDGTVLIGASSRGVFQFNPIFVASNPIAIFRGTSGGRSSMFCVADGGATNGTQSNIKSTITFQGGILDVLVDRFYLGRDRRLILAGQTPNYQATMTMGRGIVDANTAIFGLREYNQTNDVNSSPAPLGYAQGSLTILSNGTFRVNNYLWLGNTVATNNNEESTPGNTDAGVLTVLNGATAIASNILVGGPSYGFSRGNSITVSNFSTLEVSNGIAGPNQSLDTLTIAAGSTNQMQIDGNHSGPYYYVTNLVTVGSGNVIRIASIQNESFPAQIPLIQYKAGSHSGLGVVAPPGFFANLIDNGAGSTIDAVITTNQPKNIVWRNYSSNNTWDRTSANWLDLVTGLHTNFSDGDFVAFDDNVGSGAITLATGNVFVSSGIVMTNTSVNYVFSGSGGIQGSVILTKSGTGGLEIDSQTTIVVILNAGVLTGSGSIGGASLAANTTMNFTGNINGGVTSAGTATSSGQVNGSVAILTGSIYTNSGTINGLISTAPASLLVNNSFATINWITGSSIIASNSIFINHGAVNGDVLTVNNGGTLSDDSGGNLGFELTTLTLSGSVTVSTGGTNVTYPGATFLPGGAGAIGSTWVFKDSIGSFPGRLTLASGSTTYINVDFSNPQTNSQVLSFYLDFGPSQSTRLFNGVTLVMTNINPGAGSFAAGQKFHIFYNNTSGNANNFILPTGSSTNSYPVMSPAAPGVGLAWDLSRLWTNGVVGIISVPTTGTNLAFGITNIPSFVTITSFTTNGAVVTTNFATNNVIMTSMSWPTQYIGWKLQQQSAALAVGLGVDPTNWTTVLDATFTNSFTLTNQFSTNAIFYRMTYP